MCISVKKIKKLFVCLACLVPKVQAFLYPQNTQCTVPCGAHGKCVFNQDYVYAPPVCSCEYGYFGYYCEDASCLIEKCSGRGLCYDTPFGAQCRCDQYSYGRQCEHLHWWAPTTTLPLRTTISSKTPPSSTSSATSSSALEATPATAATSATAATAASAASAATTKLSSTTKTTSKPPSATTTTSKTSSSTTTPLPIVTATSAPAITTTKQSTPITSLSMIIPTKPVHSSTETIDVITQHAPTKMTTEVIGGISESRVICSEMEIARSLATLHKLTHNGTCTCPSGSCASPEAFLLNVCPGLTLPATWKQGTKVSQTCDNVPIYSPVVEFRKGHHTSDDISGILIKCTAEGYMIATQTCEQGPLVQTIQFHQDGTPEEPHKRVLYTIRL